MMEKSEGSTGSLTSQDVDSIDFYLHTMKETELLDLSSGGDVEPERKSCIQRPIHVIFFVTVFIILIAMPVITSVFVLYHGDNGLQQEVRRNTVNCTDACRLTLVESIPQNLTYPKGSPNHTSTYQGLITLLNNAQSTIEIASFYWTLQSDDVHPSDPSSREGQQLFESLYKAGKYRGIKLKIAQNKPSSLYKQHDTEILASQAGAEVRSLDFDKLMGAGILHTKMWLIDRKHFYVGSANLDWRSLTQVKELGGVVQNCSCMAEDMGKIFDVYWYLGDNTSLPSHWPKSLSTDINANYPAEITYNGLPASTYLSSSPAPFCPEGRTVDIDAIVKVIRDAEEFVYVAVMDYLPVIVNYNGKPDKFWAVIDDELRRAAFDRQVNVRVLGSIWKHTPESMARFLRSLSDISGTGQGTIQVKFFEVPTYTPAQARIPFARVNHNKYMVTEKSAYIGTSNWSGDYFVSTGGIGFIITQPKPESPPSNQLPIRQQVEDIFLRDWNSEYSKKVNKSTSLKFKSLHVKEL